MLSGRSVVGVQAAQVVQLVRWLQSRPDVSPDRIGCVGVGTLGPTALHTTVFEPDLRSLVLQQAPLSFAELARHQVYRVPTASIRKPTT